MNEPDQAIQKIDQVKDIINQFMEAYFTYKDNEKNGWTVTRNVIFYRLDAFNDRLGDILNIAKSFNEFKKMSKKFIGGIKGAALMQTLEDIFTECTNGVK